MWPTNAHRPKGRRVAHRVSRWGLMLKIVAHIWAVLDETGRVARIHVCAHGKLPFSSPPKEFLLIKTQQPYTAKSRDYMLAHLLLLPSLRHTPISTSLEHGIQSSMQRSHFISTQRFNWQALLDDDGSHRRIRAMRIHGFKYGF